MTKKERVFYLDIAKGIGMLLVVIGHTEYVSASIRQYINSFHMPLFFLISGVLIWYKEEESKEWEYLFSKKVNKLIVPYFMFSILYLIIESSRLLIKNIEGWGLIFRGFYQSICLQGISVLWFLPALFLGEMIFIWIRKNSNHVQTLWCLAALFVSIYFINIDVQTFFLSRGEKIVFCMLYDVISMLLRGFFCVGLVGVGYYTGKILLTKKITLGMEFLISIIAMFVVGIAVAQNGNTDLRGMNLGNLFWFLLCGILGSVGIIFLSKVIAKMPLRTIHRIFEYIGRNSLFIMATHIDFRILYISIKLAMLIDAVIHNRMLLSFFIILFVFVIEIVLIEIKGRISALINMNKE